MEKKPPLIVRIISTIFYVAAGWTIGNGLYIFLSGGKAMLVVGTYDLSSKWFLILIWVLLNSTLNIIVAKGIRLGKNWARIIGIVLSSVLGTYHLFLILGGRITFAYVFNLVIDYLIVLFLLTNRDVLRFFYTKNRVKVS